MHVYFGRLGTFVKDNRVYSSEMHKGAMNQMSPISWRRLHRHTEGFDANDSFDGKLRIKVHVGLFMDDAFAIACVAMPGAITRQCVERVFRKECGLHKLSGEPCQAFASCGGREQA